MMVYWLNWYKKICSRSFKINLHTTISGNAFLCQFKSDFDFTLSGSTCPKDSAVIMPFRGQGSF